jgi:hypothetical protein
VARVSVEKQALSDARFTVLGGHLDPLHKMSETEIFRAVGLLMAVRVWDYCSDRGLLVVHRRDLDAIYPGLASAMLDAELAAIEPHSAGKRVRIRGGQGRLDWSDRARRNGALGAEHGKKGAAFGKLGGRPSLDRTPHTGVSKTPLRGDTKTPPHAHALSQTQEQENPPTPRLRGARPSGPSPDARAEVEAYEALSGHRANPAAIRSAGKLIADGRGEELRKARERYTRELDAKDSPREFRIKPHNWFGRASRWTEYTGPEATSTPIGGAYVEPKGARPKGNEAYTAAYWKARDEGKSNDEAVAIAKAAMREGRSA